MPEKKWIAFMCPYPQGSAPSQRFRYEQYLHFLKEYGYEYEIFSFLDIETNSILYKKGHILKKLIGIIKGYFRRGFHLFKIKNASFIFIHREASPLGPPIFEWIIRKILKKKIIYDFDDAIWLSNTSEENKIANNLKWHSKVELICEWSYKVSAGNTFLLAFAKKYNNNVFLNPTTIDTQDYHNELRNQNEETITIGWTGSHSTLKYLEAVIPQLKNLSQRHKFIFTVIADRDPRLPLENYKFILWKKETEVKDLLNFNIGIMPLSNDTWSKGKCGFKALQYMSLGIPSVVSNVGANNEIVDHGLNGFLCDNADDWTKYLSLLIENADLRKKIGLAARKKVDDNYSVESNKNNFLSLFS